MNSILVRFPDGTKEFRYQVLAEGDVIAQDGERYRVVSVSADDADRAVAVVERDSTAGDLLRSEEGAIRLEPIVMSE